MSYKRGVFLHIYHQCSKKQIIFKEIYKYASEGGTPSTAVQAFYKDGTIPFLKIKDLAEHYVVTSNNRITEAGLKNSSAWIVPKNSVIFSNGATIGACSINKIPVATKQGILGIVPCDNISSEYLYHFFSSSIFKKAIKAITTKGTMDCAYLKDINNIKLMIPTYNVQKQIAKALDKCSNLINIENSILIALINLKHSILQQLFI